MVPGGWVAFGYVVFGVPFTGIGLEAIEIAKTPRASHKLGRVVGFTDSQTKVATF
jgi:hypothetical protein